MWNVISYSKLDINHVFSFFAFFLKQFWFSNNRRGRDGMEVGFTTTYAICAYHHWCCEFESRSGWVVQYYVIKFVSDLRQVGGFAPPVSSTNKTDHHHITEILLKVALSTIKPNQITETHLGIPDYIVWLKFKNDSHSCIFYSTNATKN